MMRTDDRKERRKVVLIQTRAAWRDEARGKISDDGQSGRGRRVMSFTPDDDVMGRSSGWVGTGMQSVIDTLE